MNQTINFDELGLHWEVEKLREEHIAISAKREIVSEMVCDFYKKGDLDSETVKYLEGKYQILRHDTDKIRNVYNYVRNLNNGYPFHVSASVGRYMVKFGLTEEQSKLFTDTHRKHLSMFERESETWKQRTIGHVKKVEWNEKDDCLHVHFSDGEWFHYTKDHEWY